MRRKLGADLIKTYMELTEKQESPRAFHKWVIISCVQQMLGRRCYIDQNLYTVYPNEYIMLCGGSGKVKKDTSIKIGVSLLEKCPNAPELFKGGITGSKLLGELSRLSERTDDEGNHLDATISLVAPEFASFIGTYPQNQDMINYLTGLYGCPDRFPYATRAHGKEELRNVCLNILSGSTVEWLRDSIPVSSVSGGFTGRILICYSKKPRKRRTRPQKPEGADKMKMDIIDDLCEIGVMEGEFSVEQKAWEFLDNWYMDLSYADDDPLGPHYERKLDHILKVAMALSAARDSKMEVTFEDVRKAKSMVDKLETGLRRVHGAFQTTATGELNQKVLKRIKTRGEISRTDLVRGMARYMNAETLDKCINTLLDGYIRREKRGKQTWYVYRDIEEEDLPEGVEEEDWG